MVSPSRRPFASLRTDASSSPRRAADQGVRRSRRHVAHPVREPQHERPQPFWDRGLLGLALHPNFPTTPYVYVLYTHDAAIGGTAPRWGTPGVLSDPCPNPPGANGDGCVVSGRLSRLQASGNTMTGQEQVLIEDWCQQYPSLSVGGLAFGADGALYASAGTGSSFTFNDWGQDGDPVNPCGDPPGGVGAVLSPPTAEGGSLRGQDTRTGGDPVTLDGTVIRVDPNTGSGLPENPLAASGDANARRIVAYGLRNPSDWPFAPEPIRSGLVMWERATSRRSTASPIHRLLRRELRVALL